MGKPEVKISRIVFIDLYVNQKKSGLEIARFFGIGRTTVSRYIKRYGLEPRTVSEVRKNKYWNAGEVSREKLRERAKSQFGENNPSYKGGHIDPNGYRIIYVNRTRIKEHRHVVQQHIGRRLTSREDVHHIDGNKVNNNISNLQLLTKKEHAQLHWDRQARRKLQSEKITAKRKDKYWSTKPRTS